MEILHTLSKLQQRGIATAAQRLNWIEARNGWEYPVLDINGCPVARRFKAYDSSANPKYYWIQKFPTGKGFYHVGAGLPAAIEAANGLLYFVNGEPAVLTMLAAGITNVVCVFGEGNYPDNTLNTLASWQVSKVVYFADKDAAGRKSADKLAGLLAGSDIQIECRAMLDTMPAKSDLNDLWQIVKFNRAAFISELANLPVFAPIIQRETKPLDAIKSTRTNSGSKWAEFIETEVLPALDRVGIRQGKKHGLCINPDHADHHPSARISERGIYLCTCGRHSLKTVAGWLGLDFKTWIQVKYPKAERASKPDQHTAQNTPQTAIKADLVVNTPYITDIIDQLPKTGVIVVISPTGTGKTTLNKRISAGKKTLVVVPFRSLVTNSTSSQDDVEDYRSIPHEYRSSANRLAICLPSTKGLIKPSQNARYDVLQLDEISRNLEMFRSRDIFPDNDATIVMSVQEKLIKDTPLVMVTDAYSTDVEIEYLRTLRPDVFVVLNTYKADFGKLVVYPEREQLQNAMEKAIKAQKGAVVFVSTSKAEVQRQYEYFVGIYGEERIISIHSGNATNKRQSDFLKVIGDSSTDAARKAAQAEIEKYTLILASPSLLTGFDVQPTVYRVFGNLFSNDIDAPGCMQLLRRYRNTEEVHVWVEPKERHLPTSAETIYNRYRAADDRTKQLVMFNEDDNRLDFDGIIARQLRLQSAILARRNRSLNNLYESFLTLAKPHYQITMVTTDAPASNLERLKEASEAVKARFKELTLTVAPISPEMHQDRSERGIRTDEDNAALNRWHIERLYRQTITEDLYNLYSEGKGATELHTYIDVMHSPESELKRHDKQQIIDGVPIHLRDNRAMKSRTIKRTMLAIFGQRRNMHADYLLPASEIVERFEAYTALHPDLMDDLSLYCGLSRNDASRAPLTIVKRICRLMGLALRKEEHPPKGTPKEAHRYGLEPDSLELMNQLAEHRLTVIAEEKDNAEQAAKTRPNIIVDTPMVASVDHNQALYDAIPSANKGKPSVLERFTPAKPFKLIPGQNCNPFASKRVGAGEEESAA